MRLRTLFTVLSTFICAFSIQAAQAEYFVWKDHGTKVSLTFPDRWYEGNGQKADEIITLIAPGNKDYASCRVRARLDARFTIHPPHLADEIQRVHFTNDFWEGYVGEFDRAVLHSVTDNAGIGRGFASMATYSYVSEVGPPVFKHGFGFVANHYDHTYIFECSAEASAYDKWYPSFLSVAKSVDFRPVYDKFREGSYRSFMSDAPVIINNGKKELPYVY